MTTRTRFLPGAVLAALLFSLVGSTPHAFGQIQAGVAAVDITPPLGSPMAGYYSARGCTGMHDPLHASALVLQRDGTTVAIVALDLISTTKDLVTEARELIAGDPGIPADAVMISASHTHTGPSIQLTGRDADQIQHASNEVKGYLAQLPQRIADAVRQAANNLQPATLRTATSAAPGVAFNRRFLMTDGTVGWNPAKRSEKIVEPVGPTDDAVPVVLMLGADQAPFAAYVNFAMHLDTVGGTNVSADYPATISNLLQGALNPELVTLFTIGTAGDINHRDVTWSNPQKGISEATRIGTHVASAALRAIRHAENVADGDLHFDRQLVELRPAPHSDLDASWARETQQRRKTSQQVAFLDQVRAGRITDVEALQGAPLFGEVQVITLGDDLAWVGLPGEIFVELGIAIKQSSPYKQTIIAELSGGSIGYVPTRRAYAQGNYEVISARVGEGSGERLVETALQMLNQLHDRSDLEK